MTLTINRAPILNNIKLWASFHHHMWNQTGVMVPKRLICFFTTVTLTFDLWPWTFAQTSLLSLVITPENLMMMPWWEHSEKGVTGTDRQTDRQTDTNFFKGKSIWKFYLQNVGHFFQAWIWAYLMPIFHQGVSSTKAKKRNSAYFKILEQNPASVKKKKLPDAFSTSSKRLQDPKWKSRLCSTIFIFHIKPLHKYTNSQYVQYA